MAGFLPARKHLSADALVRLVQARFARVADPRPGTGVIPLADALMSAFAMFSLKDPSLLAFDERRHDRNLQSLYGITRVPCDTQMRSILDPVDPATLAPAFRAIIRQLQRGKVLEDFVWHDGHYLVLIDGVEYF